ncbi:MAG: PIN domain-containing protein [Candidatus Woesearchaeota archaeon]
MVNYFFDTYAVIELLKRNPVYLKYGEFPLITTILNKIELTWWALNEHGEEFADILRKSIVHVVEIDDEVIRNAMLFRKNHKKRDISNADAIGYAYALKNNIRFLTGDQQFKGLPNVEYVK